MCWTTQNEHAVCQSPSSLIPIPRRWIVRVYRNDHSPAEHLLLRLHLCARDACLGSQTESTRTLRLPQNPKVALCNKKPLLLKTNCEQQTGTIWTLALQNSTLEHLQNPFSPLSLSLSKSSISRVFEILLLNLLKKILTFSVFALVSANRFALSRLSAAEFSILKSVLNESYPFSTLQQEKKKRLGWEFSVLAYRTR